MVINLIIALLLIFIGHQARQIEISNLKLKDNIENLRKQIEINKIEYTYHTNSDYLKKLYELYHQDIENFQEHKIISYNDFSSKDKTKIFLVDY